MKKIITIALTLICLESFSQDVNLSKSQINANFIPLTLSFESKIDEHTSFTLSGGLGYAAHYSSSSNGGTESSFIAIPFMSTSFRNYYTRKRVKKNNLKNNSGNYYGVYGSYQFGSLKSSSVVASLESSNLYTLGPVWGIERNYASGIHLGLSLGVGVIGGKYINTRVSTIGGFELGFALSSK